MINRLHPVPMFRPHQGKRTENLDPAYRRQVVSKDKMATAWKCWP